MKKVQIPEKLFFSLLRYFILEQEDERKYIASGLEDKLQSMVKHDLYSKYKTAPTAEEREKARKEYLDEVGVPQSFRW
ncbi:MAG: complexin-2 [Lachnospiraceae bacterium]|nr:complexin-2 [Lachnospiraceae bacterium]